MRFKKDTIATWSGVGMLVFGILISTAGFAVPPLGEVHGSVLWILGQALIYSGSIFGLTAYAHHKINEIETHIYEDGDTRNRTRG